MQWPGMFRQMTRTAWLSAALCATLALPGAARAQEGGEGSSVAEAEGVPRVVVVGFEDASDEDCNPIYSRYGRCVEEVKYVDMTPAWDADIPADDLDRAQWRNTGRLYAGMWEDVAFRWNKDADPLQVSIKTKGVWRLPDTKQQWEASARTDEDTRVYALPRSSLWLDRGKWLDPRADVPMASLSLGQLISPTSAFYPAVRFAKAAGLVPSPAMVILRGRFAKRLAVDNKLHPYDLMDGDPTASGPLFEQMYPYQRGLAGSGGDDSRVPLADFVISETLKSKLTGDAVSMREAEFRDLVVPVRDGYEPTRALAYEQFERFYRLVGVQILRFAREEFTPTHLRVLTSLVAMESPPIDGGDGYVSVDAVVAAARGQMDDIAPGPSSFGGYARSKGFAINAIELPPELVEKYIVTMSEWMAPSEEFRAALMREIVKYLSDYLRSDVVKYPADYVPKRLDDDYLKGWIQDNAFPGRVPEVTRYFKRVALDLLISRLDEVTKEEVQTNILLDHVNLAIRASFGPSEGNATSPADLEARTAEAWQTILGLHDMYPFAIPDRPGVVNPIAICTVSDRLDALAEPVFRKVDVDILVKAPGWLTSVEELLWEVREDVPFIFMDDPEQNPPAVDRLVGLPGDQAIYRIRWKVWAGWHLTWGVEPLSESDPGAPRRLALRTGAICDDTVLASPDLVPTLTRAALLEGDFRPTVPVPDTGKTRKPKKNKGNDQLVVDADRAFDEGETIARTGKDVDKALSGDGDAQVTLARQAIGGLTLHANSRRLKRLGIDPTPVRSDDVRYVRDLIEAPLRASVGEKPLMVTVVEHGTPGERERIWHYRPHTPYQNAQTKVAKKEFVRSSMWAYEVEKPEVEEIRYSVSPAYQPTELLSTAEPKQLWKRRTTSEWNFGGSIGFFPYRYTKSRCGDVGDDIRAGWEAVVASCTPGGATQDSVFTSEVGGFGVDLLALNTQWLTEDRRFGIEYGPEVRLDVLAPFVASAYDTSGATTANTRYGIALRFAAGAIVGVRFAPDPAPLWRRGGRRFPWGAPLPDGATQLGRIQWGLRAGFLLGPTWDGLEGTAVLDWWLGASVRGGGNGKSASLTPYHPSVLIGPFARAQVGFLMVPNASRYLKLDHSIMAIVGLRMHLRLLGKPELKVEAP